MPDRYYQAAGGWHGAWDIRQGNAGRQDKNADQGPLCHRGSLLRVSVLTLLAVATSTQRQRADKPPGPRTHDQCLAVPGPQLPGTGQLPAPAPGLAALPVPECPASRPAGRDRKSTRLNSSHPSISYAVFCLKKKKKKKTERKKKQQKKNNKN